MESSGWFAFDLRSYRMVIWNQMSDVLRGRITDYRRRLRMVSNSWRSKVNNWSPSNIISELWRKHLILIIRALHTQESFGRHSSIINNYAFQYSSNN